LDEGPLSFLATIVQVDGGKVSPTITPQKNSTKKEIYMGKSRAKGYIIFFFQIYLRKMKSPFCLLSVSTFIQASSA
jgi:hypothetical protein